MGNGPAGMCCCSADGSTAVPASFDMVNPQLQQDLFLNQLDLRSIEGDSKLPEEAALQEIAKLENRGAESSLRMQLLTATRHDDAPGVLQYVADGADISDMAEALRLAAQRGSASVVRELVAVGLSVNEGCPHSGFTPLQLSAASGHLTVCELLLDALADVHMSVGGTTSLNLARKMGNVEVEEVLERHVASLLMEQEGEGEDAAQWNRRAHVLPRVSPVLSEAVLQALPRSTSQSPTASPSKQSLPSPASAEKIDSTAGQQPDPPTTVAMS